MQYLIHILQYAKYILCYYWLERSLKDNLTLAVTIIFLPQSYEIMFFGDIFQTFSHMENKTKTCNPIKISQVFM